MGGQSGCADAGGIAAALSPKVRRHCWRQVQAGPRNTPAVPGRGSNSVSPSSWILRVMVLWLMPSLCAASMPAPWSATARQDQPRLELAGSACPRPADGPGRGSSRLLLQAGQPGILSGQQHRRRRADRLARQRRHRQARRQRRRPARRAARPPPADPPRPRPPRLRHGPHWRQIAGSTTCAGAITVSQWQRFSSWPFGPRKVEQHDLLQRGLKPLYRRPAHWRCAAGSGAPAWRCPRGARAAAAGTAG